MFETAMAVEAKERLLDIHFGRHLARWAQAPKISQRAFTSFLAGFLLLLYTQLLCTQRSQAQVVTVNWGSTDQVIDGFGAATAGRRLTSAQATFLFSTSSGNLGLSLLRTDVPDDGSCSTVNTTCAGEVSNMQLALANGAQVWSTPWSPPASMKTNGNTTCNAGPGNGSLSVGSYSDYATYLANYVTSLSSLYGIQLYALSVQNEPDNCPSYPGALWSGANFDTFIKTLGPAFASAGISNTLIMTPESSRFSALAPIASVVMADPAAASYVGIIAWHDYDNAPSVTNPYASQKKLYWETEASAGPGYGPSLCGGCWDPSMADALMWAQIVDNRMAVANANAWNYWEAVGYTDDNEGLTNIYQTVSVSKRAYMLGNYSMFVRPGFYRIDATHTPQPGVLVSAYNNSSTGALVIVVINQNSSAVSQSFTLSGAIASNLTPWITSNSLNLAQQSAVSVTGGSFTYSLPGYSITSFVGNATASLAPPTGLTATVK